MYRPKEVLLMMLISIPMPISFRFALQNIGDRYKELPMVVRLEPPLLLQPLPVAAVLRHDAAPTYS